MQFELEEIPQDAGVQNKPVVNASESAQNSPLTKIEQSRGDLVRIKVDLAELPSQGVCYPERATIHRVEYLWTEIRNLSEMIKDIDNEEEMIVDKPALYECMMEGIYVEGFDKYDLTLSDLLFIFILRKMGTFGNQEIVITVQCPHCGQYNILGYKLNDFEFEDLMFDRTQLPLFTEIKGLECQFMPLTFRRFKQLYEDGVENDPRAWIAYQCINRDPREVYELCKDLPYIGGGDVLDQIDEYLSHGLMDVEATCLLYEQEPIPEEEREAINERGVYLYAPNQTTRPKLDENGQAIKCNGRFNFALDGGRVLYLPFRKARTSVKSRIGFGVALKTGHF